MTKIGPLLPDDIADAYAIQAVFKGTANEPQMIRACKCIVEEICGTYDMSFDPESQRQTDFNEGRRHVGRLLVGIATINLSAVKRADEARIQRSQPPVIKRKRGT